MYEISALAMFGEPSNASWMVFNSIIVWYSSLKCHSFCLLDCTCSNNHFFCHCCLFLIKFKRKRNITHFISRGVRCTQYDIVWISWFCWLFRRKFDVAFINMCSAFLLGVDARYFPFCKRDIICRFEPLSTDFITDDNSVPAKVEHIYDIKWRSALLIICNLSYEMERFIYRAFFLLASIYLVRSMIFTAFVAISFKCKLIPIQRWIATT